MRLTLLVLSLATLACSRPAAGQTSVVRVIDGDTYELSDGERVRLIGIDTPEKHASAKLTRDARRSGRDAAALQQLGTRASRHARQLVQGRRVTLEYDPANAATGHRDRYGRILAYVWASDAAGRRFMVNEQLIADGYAHAYTQYPFDHAARFLAAERRAREAGRGLWGDGLGAGAAPSAPARSSRGSGPDRDCSDFDTQRAAQRFFDGAGPGDPHRLDRDGDGVVCESLPAYR